MSTFLRKAQDKIMQELENKSLAAVGDYFKRSTKHVPIVDIARVAGVSSPMIYKYFQTMTWVRCHQILSRLHIGCVPVEEVLLMCKLQKVIFEGATVAGPTSSTNEHLVLLEKDDKIYVVHTGTNQVVYTYSKEE